MSNIKKNFCTCCGDKLDSQNEAYPDAYFCCHCGDAQIDNDIAQGEQDAYDMYVSKEEERNNYDSPSLQDMGLELHSFEDY